MISSVPVMLITGPIGVGKTTIAAEVSELLDQAQVAHGLVDVDCLRWCYPRPSHDPFRVELAMKNLAAIWSNFQDVGATHLVLADVLESRSHLERYQRAIPAAKILVVRLHASLPTIMSRVQRREVGSGLDRHLRRASELAAHMEQNKVEDMLVDTEGRSVATVAHEVLTRSTWMIVS